MKVGEIWDYYKHRKGLLFAVLVFAIMLGGLGCKMLNRPTHSPQTTQSQALDSFTAGVYNNTLNIKLVNKAEVAVCQLNFGEEFRKVSITATADELESETYIRIFDANGNLLASEYSAVDDAVSTPEQIIYRFPDTPKAYTIELTPGAIIEIQARKARFYSNLTGAENHYFDLERTGERYVVTDYGLRKESWNDETGNEVMYDMLRRYLIPQIEQYRDNTAQEILDNKDLDTANKSRILLAYYALDSDDQVIYAEFAELLKQGKVPEITEEPENPGPVEDETPDEELGTYPPMDYVENPNLIAERGPEENHNEVVDTGDITMGGGNNVAYSVQTTSESEDDDTIETTEEENPDETENVVDPLPKQNKVENKENSLQNNRQEVSQQKSDNSFILWLVFGGIAVILLIKFIFDHYVR